MKLHRFLVDFSKDVYNDIIKNRELVHQIEKVLRLKPGEEFILFNKDGDEFLVKILNFENEGVVFTVLKKGTAKFVGKEVVLACAVIKRDNYEWVVQKATEVGVSVIMPIITDHSVKLGLQMKRLERISIEAVEQSGRGTVPKIYEPQKFEDVLRHSEGKLKIFCDAGGENFDASVKNTSEPIVIFVGPEGGWSDKEREIAKASGCKIISLGSTVLRTETAATVASFLAVNS